MLLAVLGLFLSTEVPQGLLGLASALAPDFFKNCYGMFGKNKVTILLLLHRRKSSNGPREKVVAVALGQIALQPQGISM